MLGKLSILSAVGLLLWVTTGEALNKEPTAMEEHASKLADELDVYAAVEYLSEQEDLVAAVKTLNALGQKAYWDQKDIGRCVTYGRAGVQLGLVEGRRVAKTDPELSEQLLGQAKAVSYNLASFAWPGWGEEGIVLSPSDISMGFDAAKLNLRLAIELKRGADPMGKAHWMLGAYYLAVEDPEAAKEQFGIAADFEREASPEGKGLLSEGYRVVTDLIAQPDESKLSAELAQIQDQLRKLEDGAFFADQLSTALRVFAASSTR
jgi:hypothetical protein